MASGSANFLPAPSNTPVKKSGLFPNGVPASGVNQTNEYGLGGQGTSAPGYTFVGGADQADPLYSGRGGYVAPPDPYAAWGGRAAYDAKVNNYESQHQGILGSANSQVDIYGNQYQRGILDFVDNQRLAQGAIDTKASRNELAKMQGVQGVLGSVGRGIKSSGVMLANRNAGDSSAAQALANAYGDQGRRQLSGIGNQYEMGNQDIQAAQDAYAIQQASGLRQIQGSKDDFVNKLALDTRNSLADLDARIAGESLPNRIAYEQEKEAVKAQALQKLQAYDAQLQSGVQGIRATDADQRRARAAELMNAGTNLGSDAFNYTTETPTQFQGTGPFSSELPLFSLARGKRIG